MKEGRAVREEGDHGLAKAPKIRFKIGEVVGKLTKHPKNTRMNTQYGC